MVDYSGNIHLEQQFSKFATIETGATSYYETRFEVTWLSDGPFLFTSGCPYGGTNTSRFDSFMRFEDMNIANMTCNDSHRKEHSC